MGDEIMRNNKIILCSILLIVVMFGGIIIFNIFKILNNTKIESFNLNDEPYYLQAIQDFPSDKLLGEITTAKNAKEKASSEWIKLFGEKVKNEKPYKVLYDEQNEIWLVKGSLPKGWKGGVSYILIQKSDGKILAIWHDQ